MGLEMIPNVAVAMAVAAIPVKDSSPNNIIPDHHILAMSQQTQDQEIIAARLSPHILDPDLPIRLERTNYVTFGDTTAYITRSRGKIGADWDIEIENHYSGLTKLPFQTDIGIWLLGGKSITDIDSPLHRLLNSDADRENPQQDLIEIASFFFPFAREPDQKWTFNRSINLPGRARLPGSMMTLREFPDGRFALLTVFDFGQLLISILESSPTEEQTVT